jgi:hypothetical protein
LSRWPDDPRPTNEIGDYPNAYPNAAQAFRIICLVDDPTATPWFMKCLPEDMSVSASGKPYHAPPHTVASRATVVTMAKAQSHRAGRARSVCSSCIQARPLTLIERLGADLASGNLHSFIHPGEIQS